jgi:hypothetical protein
VFGFLNECAELQNLVEAGVGLGVLLTYLDLDEETGDGHEGEKRERGGDVAQNWCNQRSWSGHEQAERTVYAATQSKNTRKPPCHIHDRKSGVPAVVSLRLGGERYVHLGGVPETGLSNKDWKGRGNAVVLRRLPLWLVGTFCAASNPSSVLPH